MLADEHCRNTDHFGRQFPQPAAIFLGQLPQYLELMPSLHRHLIAKDGAA